MPFVDAMFGALTVLKVVGESSSEVFGNLPKMFEKVRVAFGQLHYSLSLANMYVSRKFRQIDTGVKFVYLQISSDSFNEEHPAILSCVLKSSTFHFISDSGDNILNFIISKQTWNLTRSQQIVDQHKETLFRNLCVRQQEHSADVFQPCLVTQVC